MADRGTGSSEIYVPMIEDEFQYDYVGRPLDLPSGSFVGIAADDTAERARRLEYEVFLQQGYCAESSAHRVAEYERWDSLSKFHVVLDPAGELLAAVRTTAGSYADLPVGKFERWDQYPPDSVVEYASLVVAPESRGVGAAEALYRSVVHEAVAGGHSGIVAIGEAWLLDLLNSAYDSGFRALGPSRWYMGGECFPMGTSMVDLWNHFRARQPTFYRWFMEGIHEIDLRDSSGTVDVPGVSIPELTLIAGS